jgi:hypothetical protein
MSLNLLSAMAPPLATNTGSFLLILNHWPSPKQVINIDKINPTQPQLRQVSKWNVVKATGREGLMVHQPKTVHLSDREEIPPHPDLVQPKGRQTSNPQQVTMSSEQNYFKTTFQQSAIKVSLDQRSQLRASESSLVTTHEIPRNLPVPEQRSRLGPFSNRNLMSRWLHVKRE